MSTLGPVAELTTENDHFVEHQVIAGLGEEDEPLLARELA